MIFFSWAIRLRARFLQPSYELEIFAELVLEFIKQLVVQGFRSGGNGDNTLYKNAFNCCRVNVTKHAYNEKTNHVVYQEDNLYIF